LSDHNLIPEWNDPVIAATAKRSIDCIRPTFSGSPVACPRRAKRLRARYRPAVTTKIIEMAIIDKDSTRVGSSQDRRRNARHGLFSDPPGWLSAAAQLNQAGHLVTSTNATIVSAVARTDPEHEARQGRGEPAHRSAAR
jgi:hypothetical protein